MFSRKAKHTVVQLIGPALLLSWYYLQHWRVPLSFHFGINDEARIVPTLLTKCMVIWRKLFLPSFIGCWYKCVVLRAIQRGLWMNRCRIWDPIKLNFLTKYNLLNWILAQFETLELNFLLILRLWSLTFLEMCDLGWK